MASEQFLLDHTYQRNYKEVLTDFPDKCVDLIFADLPYILQLQNELF
ncbi:MAG: hypothetical protein WCI88_14930 [Chloroflexota bacterium]